MIRSDYKGKSVQELKALELRLIILFSFSTFLLTSTAPLAQDRLSNKDSLTVQSVVLKYMKRNNIPGMIMGIVRGDKVIYTGAFGVRNMETGDRLMTTDKLPIASITKLFTATAVMRLADNGSLSIDDPVIKYLPYFKVQGDYTKITLRHLLTHSSGLPVILPEKEWLREDSSTGALEATVRGLENIELNSQPGTQFGYSNLGYIVLSDIVAKVSKMEFEAYVTANILEPLRMHNSNFITSSPSTVAAHTKQGQKVIPINGHVENKGTNGAGGLESSIADLCTWAMMALGNGTLNETEIVKATTFKMMIEPQVLEYTDNKAYEAHRGFGWQVLRYENEPYFGHAGRYKFGGRSMLFILPEKALGIVFVANLTFNEEFDLLTDIEKMIDR